MSIQQAIQSIPNWTTKTASELLTELQAVTVTTTDSQLYTYAGIILKLGDSAGLGLRAALRELTLPNNPSALPIELYEALDFAHARLEGPGLDFSLASVQSIIDSLVMIPQLAAMVPSLKAIGVQVSNPWSSLNLQEVEAALAAIDEEQALINAQAKRTAQASSLRHAITQLEEGATLTNAELVALVQSNLPSE